MITIQPCQWGERMAQQNEKLEVQGKAEKEEVTREISVRDNKKSHSISFSVLEKGPKMLLLTNALNDCNNGKKPFLAVEIIYDESSWFCEINRIFT